MLHTTHSEPLRTNTLHYQCHHGPYRTAHEPGPRRGRVGLRHTPCLPPRRPWRPCPPPRRSRDLRRGQRLRGLRGGSGRRSRRRRHGLRWLRGGRGRRVGGPARRARRGGRCPRVLVFGRAHERGEEGVLAEGERLEQRPNRLERVARPVGGTAKARGGRRGGGRAAPSPPPDEESTSRPRASARAAPRILSVEVRTLSHLTPALDGEPWRSRPMGRGSARSEPPPKPRAEGT